jgi:hypothetical protein
VSCKFIFCLHNHQPVGNFDHVFEWAYRDCYNKTIDILSEYPEFRFAIHNSGSLLEWIDARHPEFMDKIRKLTERGQIEVIGGGFYEPILSIISESDIRGQINLMQDFCGKKFGARPKGFWTAERVWDPDIPRLVSGSGLGYTILDDNHFRYAGIEEDELHGYFITERLGHVLRIFPIDRFLRYSIPFRQPEETVNYFKERADRLGDSAFLYGDDGEKFGVWPDTFKWVFEEKWLVRFIETILKNNWIEMVHPSEYIASNPPKGRVYVTQGSYYELSEWALPSKVARKLINIHRDVKNSGRENDFYPFLKGGVWNNFLNKYPESNALNKRTLLLSAEIDEYGKTSGRDMAAARAELYKSECNCAYWHGLFGGIYLGSLRHAIHEHMLKAERILVENRGDEPDVIERDIWNEGQDQILIRNKNQSTVIVPYRGGAVSEIGVYRHAFNICNTVTRRYEAYHDSLVEFDEDAHAADEVKSIHDIVKVKEKGLKNYLIYDDTRRYSFKEIFFGAMPSAEDLFYRRADAVELGNSPYNLIISKSRREIKALLTKETTFRGNEIRIAKEFLIPPEKGLAAQYKISGAGKTLLGVELNFNLLGGHDDDRKYDIPGLPDGNSYLDSIGMTEKIKSFGLVDKYAGFRINVQSTKEAILLRYPILTISQSDSGFEKNFQGSCIVLVYSINSDEFEFEIKIEAI